MSRFGFCSGFYSLPNINADCQTCMNWFPETNESQLGKSAIVLNPTPGLALFAAIPGVEVRGEWTINGRTFAVVDATLYEVFGDGTFTALGLMANDGEMVSMVASPQQLAVASAGFLYVYYLRIVGAVPAGTFVAVPAATFPGPVSEVALSDDFFLALIASTEQFFASLLLDATVWPPLQTKIINTFPDNAVGFIVDHRQVWIMGGKSSEVEYDSGNFPMPFDTAPGGFVEQGLGAKDSLVQLDNSIFWIGTRNDIGGGMAWRANGYTPQRVSTHAIEAEWAKYATIADARAFSYQDGGHSFWHINFPTANKTWVLDVATGLWHERSFWFADAGIFQAALPQCHTFNFAKHLVGDRRSGNIYTMAMPSVSAGGGGWDFVTDNGALIRRVRRAPHVSTEQEWIYHARLQVDFETGLGPQPPLLDGAGAARAPMATLRYSDDGGHKFSNGSDVGCGQAGDFRARAIWRRLGRSRDRVYELSVSDPVPWFICDAYLKAAPDFTPKKRLTKEMSEVA